jgi:hypothetical protein
MTTPTATTGKRPAKMQARLANALSGYGLRRKRRCRHAGSQGIGLAAVREPGRKPDQSLDTFVWNGRIHGVIGASETSNSGGVAER